MGLCPTQLITWPETSQYWCLWAVGYGQGCILRLKSQREDSKIALASTSVHMVEHTPKNDCCQFLCPTGELQLSPAFPRNSSESAGRYDLDSFQITASALGSGACEILFVPFNSRVSISFPLAFKAKHSRGLSSQCRTPRLGSLMWGSDLSLCREKLCNYNYSPICGLPTWGYGS